MCYHVNLDTHSVFLLQKDLMDEHPGSFHSYLNHNEINVSTINPEDYVDSTLLQTSTTENMDLDLIIKQIVGIDGNMDMFFEPTLDRYHDPTSPDINWPATPDSLRAGSVSPQPQLMSPASSVASVIVPAPPVTTPSPRTSAGRKRGAPAKTYQPGEEDREAKAIKGQVYRKKKQNEKEQLANEVVQLREQVEFLRIYLAWIEEMNEKTIVLFNSMEKRIC